MENLSLQHLFSVIILYHKKGKLKYQIRQIYNLSAEMSFYISVDYFN